MREKVLNIQAEKFKRKDIQIFRGIAVLLVLLSHLYPITLQNWKIGVDIFFVISGFVITKSLLNTNRFNTKNLISFFKRRISRIFPLAIISSLLIWLTFEILSPETFSNFDVIASASGLENILLGIKGNTYNSIGANLNPFTPFWSLGVEEQYYFVYPFLVYFVFKSRINFRKGEHSSEFQLSKNKFFLKSLLITLVTLVSFSFILYIFNYSSANAWSYYNPLFRFWEIGFGCISYIYLKIKENKKINGHRNLIKLIFLLIFINISFLSLSVSNEYYIYSLVFTLILFSLYLSITPLDIKDTNKTNLINEFLLIIGNNSFSIYIWHWPLLLGMKIIYGNNLSINNIILYLIFLALISGFSRQLIELKIGDLLSSNKSFNQISFYAISLFLLGASSLIPFLGEKGFKVFRPYIRSTNSDTFVSKIVPSSKENNCGWGYEDPFNDKNDIKRLEKCIKDQISDNQKNTIFLVGDSHSTAVAPAIFKYTKNNNLNFARASHVYCPFRTKFSMNWQVQTTVDNFSCSRFNESFLELIKKTAVRGDTIVLNSRDQYYFSNTAPTSQEHLKDFKNGFIKYLDSDNNFIPTRKVLDTVIQDIKNLSLNLNNRGIKLLVILQPHENKLPVFYCDHLLSELASDCTVFKNEIEKKRDYARVLLSIKEKISNINIIDLFAKSCEGEACKHTIQKKYIFRDDDHISNYAATKYFYADIKNSLDSLKN